MGFSTKEKNNVLLFSVDYLLCNCKCLTWGGYSVSTLCQPQFVVTRNQVSWLSISSSSLCQWFTNSVPWSLRVPQRGLATERVEGRGNSKSPAPASMRDTPLASVLCIGLLKKLILKYWPPYVKQAW